MIGWVIKMSKEAEKACPDRKIGDRIKEELNRIPICDYCKKRVNPVNYTKDGDRRFCTVACMNKMIGFEAGQKSGRIEAFKDGHKEGVIVGELKGTRAERERILKKLNSLYQRERKELVPCNEASLILATISDCIRTIEERKEPTEIKAVKSEKEVREEVKKLPVELQKSSNAFVDAMKKVGMFDKGDGEKV